MKTLRQHIRKLSKAQFIELRNYCLHSNSLYNSALYLLKEEFKVSKKYLGYNEVISKQEEYLGKRIKRGLFKTSKNILCNADINGSANILRKKVISNLEFKHSRDEIEAFIVRPKMFKKIFNGISLNF